MAEESNNQQMTELERQLKAAERMAQSLTQVELLYRGEIQKEDEARKSRKEVDAAYLREFQKQDEARKETREAQEAYEGRQKRWDQREAEMKRIGLPFSLGVLAFGVAFAALAITLCILIVRR